MKKTRRGMMMMELIVACVLLGTLLAVCVQMLSAVASQRRAAERRQCAMQELGNVMERIAVRPWSKLSTATLVGEKPAAAVAALLPEADLKIEVVAMPNEPEAKRITAILCWQEGEGRPVARAALSTWRYKLD